MKKIFLLINLSFLTVLAFLSASVIIIKEHGYVSDNAGLLIERTVGVSCGSRVSNWERASSSYQSDQYAAIPGRDAGSGCLHRSGTGTLCLITGSKRRRPAGS
jgi:hypothetical protein